MATKTRKRQRSRDVPHQPRESTVVQSAVIRRRVWIAALLALAAIVYARSLANQFVYDDNEEIRLNHFIGQWSFIWRSFINDSWWFRNPARLPQSAYYRPLQDAWFALNYHAFGMNPVGWHLTMIALEVMVVWLVFRVAEELTADFRAALIGAALFAVMPVHAQAVVWPSAVPLPLSVAFQLGALLMVIVPRGSIGRVVAPVLYVLALLSHESAIVFPALVVAYAFLFVTPPESQKELLISRIRRAMIVAAPFFAIALVYLGVRFAVLGFITRHNPGNHMSPYAIVLTTAEVIGQYLVLLVIPWRADPAHAILPITSIFAPVFYLTMLGLCAIFLAAWAIIAQRARLRLYQFCVFWMFVFIVPVLNLGVLNPVELIADRYVYMPSVGWCILLGSLAGELMAIGEAARNAAVAVLAAFWVGSAAILWHIEAYWQNEIALFSRAAEVAPGAWLWHERLGMAFKGAGKFDDAVRELAASNALDPRSGSALYNIALIHLEQGQSRLAQNEMMQALPRIEDAPPEAYGEAARVALQNGDIAAAERVLDRASKLPGGAAPAAIGRAEIKLAQHDNQAAATILEDTTSRYPDNADAWELLARTQLALGNDSAALSASERAVACSPNAGWYRVLHAQLLDKAGRHAEAIAEYRRALEVQPDDPALRKIVAQTGAEALQ